MSAQLAYTCPTALDEEFHDMSKTSTTISAVASDWRRDPKLLEVRERITATKAVLPMLELVSERASQIAMQTAARATELRSIMELGLGFGASEEQVRQAEADAKKAQATSTMALSRLADQKQQIELLGKLQLEREDAVRLEAEESLRQPYLAAVAHLSETLEAAVDAYREVQRLHNLAEQQFPERWQATDGSQHAPMAGLVITRWSRHFELNRADLENWRRSARADGMLQD
jgi:hypothetical protein